MRGPYVFLLKGIKRLQIPRILRVSEDEQRRGQAVLYSFITPSSPEAAAFTTG